VLPSFRFIDLGASASDEVVERLSIALTTVGALQITSIPRFREARLAALGPLAQCLWKNKEDANLTKMVMPDGAPRLTTHAASTRGAASAFGSACGDSAAELREAIDAGTRQLLLSLDKARVPAVDVCAPYTSFEDIQRYGDHLEHLHAYYAPQRITEGPELPSVDFHTDGGLFIAMTSGLYSKPLNSSGEGLYLQLPSSEVVRMPSADTQESLVFLVGEAGSNWLAPVLGRRLRAVPHKLVAALPADGHRTWYGKMFLPPADAVVGPTTLTYAAVREKVNRELRDGRRKDAIAALPAACGPSSYLVSSTSCTTSDGSAGVECWMQCMSVASLPCSTQAVCFDSATNTTNDGTVMCPTTCSLQCPHGADGQGRIAARSEA
jgi:hypothetical protein